MTRVVHIVDYGIGNLLSVARAVERAGGEARLTRDADAIAGADRVILPGVGAFEACVRTLHETGLAAPTIAFARGGRPFLGICVGMQMLFDYSLEFGTHAGLGLIPGRVAAIPTHDDTGSRKVPHIGWSALALPAGRRDWDATILDRLAPGRDAAYFLHSFACEPTRAGDCLAVTDYAGVELCAAVMRDNLVGCQFHPEKSGPVGLTIVERFLSL